MAGTQASKIWALPCLGSLDYLGFVCVAFCWLMHQNYFIGLVVGCDVDFERDADLFGDELHG